jgi:hypothetical protein
LKYNTGGRRRRGRKEGARLGLGLGAEAAMEDGGNSAG